MDLREILFLGGKSRLASVQIRCVAMAKELGCDYLLNQHHVATIPDKYAAFVCVKAVLQPGELAKLAERGPVIWDIIDAPPPREHVSTYLASTKVARDLFDDYGRMAVIPHYHCNIDGQPNLPNLRRPGWLGSEQWHPKLKGFNYDFYDVKGMSREDVIRAHRKIGIGLNFRAKQAQHFPPGFKKIGYQFHLAVNSGIKLINCIGFGTPSISADEPAYEEIGPECTIFSSLGNCAKGVRLLQNDAELYADLRKKCLRKAPKYHFTAVAEKYRKLLTKL